MKTANHENDQLFLQKSLQMKITNYLIKLKLLT